MKNWTDTEKALYRNTEASNTLWASIDFGIDSSGAAVTYDIAATNIVANTTKLIQSISDAEQLKYGSVEPSMFEIQIAQDTAQVERVEASAIAGMGRGKIWDCAQGKKLTVYIKKGIIEHSAEFFIKSIKGEGTTKFKTITAYDALSLFDKNVAEWYNGLNFNSLTLKAFRESLCTYCGVEFESVTLPNDSMTISRTMSATSITGREILAQCCELCGCWPKIDLWGTNKLKWVTLGATSCETFDYSQYDYTFRPDSTREEYDCKGINAVIIRATDDDVGGHYPATVQDNPYIIQGNFLCFGKSTAELTTIAQNIYNKIANKPYRPHKTVITGRPYLEPGDKVTVKFADGNGGTFDTYILKRTMTGEAALLDTYEAKGEKEHREQYGISQQIQQIQGRTNELTRTVEETVNTITHIEYLTPVLSKTDPSTEWADDEKAAKEGYQWFDGTDLRIWDGAAWKLTIYPDYIQSTKPNNPKVGEYWYNPTTGKILKCTSPVSWVYDSTVCIPTTWTQTMQTQLKITAEGVQSTVTKDNIISTINQSAESVSIDASKINLTGYVTVNSLKAGGTTQIDGGRITTGKVAAARIDVDDLYVKHLSAADGTFSGTLQGVNGTFLGTLQGVSGYFNTLSTSSGAVNFYTNYIDISGVQIGYAAQYSDVCVVPTGAGVGNIGVGNYYWDQVKANRFAQASSERYKKNILNAADSDFSDIAEIRIVTYENKNGKSGRQIGVIAEELYKVFPYAVCLNDAGEPDGVEYGKLSLLAIEAIQKLEKRVKKLEERRFI
ncbi:MAG: tail fiber domain-containing protein [Eubacteriales bacterium]|nr:tail fiber domain-containing protein [Eubacteriales bacterium]